jgi:outer membrane lipoprotein-sorting protein
MRQKLLMKILSSWTLLCAIPLLVCGQDFKADMADMNHFYLGLKDFQADVRIDVYSNNNKQVPSHTRKAELKKKGEQFLYKLDKTEMLLNEQELIIMSPDEKILTYRKIAKEEFAATKFDYFTLQADSLLKTYDSVRYEGISNGRKTYVIYSAKKLVQKTFLVIDSKEKYIVSMTNYYNPKVLKSIGRVEILYQNINSSPVFPDALFDDRQYITKLNGKIQAAVQYKGFMLNLVNEKK